MRRAICDPDNPNTGASSGASWRVAARAVMVWRPEPSGNMELQSYVLHTIL